MTVSRALFMKQDDARCFYYHLSLISGHPRGSFHNHLPFTDEGKDSNFQQLAQHTCPVCEISDSGVQASSSSSQIFFSDGMPHPKTLLFLIQGDSITNLIFAPPHVFFFFFLLQSISLYVD